MIDLPLGLRHALESGECVLFIGAGIGIHLLDADGSSAPTAAMLAEELVNSFEMIRTEVSNLTKIASIVELRRGRLELRVLLVKDNTVQPDEQLKWLFTRRWKAIYTTNYDMGIERAYNLFPILHKNL